MAMLANSLIVWCEVWKRKDNPKTSPWRCWQRSHSECRFYPIEAGQRKRAQLANVL
jgi:hypothetical protein